MNKNANPINYIIWCVENDFKPSSFDIHNAKDELQKLKEKSADTFRISGWVRINSRGDLYDPRFSLNPHLDESSLLPFYINTIEYQSKHDKLSQ